MAIVNGLISLAEAKRQIYGVTPAAGANDSDIEDFISAATPVIEDMVGPMYARSQTITLDGGRRALVLPWAFNAITSITENGITLATTDYIPLPTVGIVYRGTTTNQLDWYSGTKNVVVVATVGLTPIPTTIKQATATLVQHWWQVGRQGGRPAFDTNSQQDMWTPTGFLVPRRVEQLCRPYAKIAGFA